jgi:hypothetical protein
MYFDSQTGQPVYPQQMYQQPPAQKKSKTGLIVGLSVGGTILCVAVVLLLLVTSGVFLSKPDKVIRAFGNTFQQTQLMEDLDISSIVAKGSYRTDVSVSADDAVLDASYSVTPSAKRLDASVGISQGWYSFNVMFAAILDKEHFAVQIPTFGSDIYVYNYTQENTGFITDIMSEDEIAQMNRMLSELATSSGSDELEVEAAEVFLSEFRSLTFVDAVKRDWIVDGKTRSCKGYQTVIKQRNWNHILDQLEEIYGDEADELFKNYYGYSALEEMRDLCSDVPNITATFYIYRNQIACISLLAEGEEFSIQFQGGDRPTQNMKIVSGDDKIVVTGYYQNGTEYTNVSYNGNRAAYINYNTLNGKVTAEIYDDDEEYGVDATIVKTRDALNITINDIVWNGVSLSTYVDFQCVISVEKGAEIQPFEGKAKDIGNMSEESLEAILDAIEDEVR